MLRRAPVGNSLMRKVMQERLNQEKPNFNLEPPALPWGSLSAIKMVTILQGMKDEFKVLEWRIRVDPNKPQPLSNSEECVRRHKSQDGRPQQFLHIFTGIKVWRTADEISYTGPSGKDFSMSVLADVWWCLPSSCCSAQHVMNPPASAQLSQ